jgi:MFS transporter, Spinster family, sphingosine-1-phosphate transporter
MHALPAATGQNDAYLYSKRHAWFAFALTFLLMAFDFIDRQVVVSMFPHLKTAWGVSDKQLGALISVISITVALGALPISVVTDRWSRVKSIVVMGTLWSLATIACAFSRSYSQLLAARSMIGVGEAAYGPAGGALLSNVFPQRLRATVIGAFLTASYVGSVLGVVLGGVITARWGWQAAFGVVGLPGLVLALLFLFVRDYETVALPDNGAAPRRMGLRRAAGELFRARSGIAAYFGGALQLITSSTIYAWLPSYLNRAYGLPVDKAGAMAAIAIIAGSVGAVLWAHVADRLGRRHVRSRLLIPAACGVATLVLLGTAFGALPPSPLQFALIVAGGFTMTSTTGTIPAVAIDVVHPGLRATAGSMVAVVQNLFGLGVGPFITGALSDLYGLQTALALVPFSCLLSAVVLLLGSRSYEADLANVRASERAIAGGAVPAAA